MTMPIATAFLTAIPWPWLALSILGGALILGFIAAPLMLSLIHI